MVGFAQTNNRYKWNKLLRLIFNTHSNNENT